MSFHNVRSLRRFAPYFSAAAGSLAPVSACSTYDARVPGDAWLQYASPAEAGFDSVAVANVCAYADSVGSAAVMAVFRGRGVLACGAVDRKFELHSVRKSLLSGLIGTAGSSAAPPNPHKRISYGVFAVQRDVSAGGIRELEQRGS